MRTVFLALLLVFSQADALSKSGGKGGGHHASAPAGGSAAHSGGGGGMNHRLNPRNVPPLAADRKVNAQDCSKPVDWANGNVKCK